MAAFRSKAEEQRINREYAHRSRAEERRAEWLLRQYAAEQASGVGAFVSEQVAESKKKHAHAARLAALTAAVVEAAMDKHHALLMMIASSTDETRHAVDLATGGEWAVCAALLEAEKDGNQ